MGAAKTKLDGQMADVHVSFPTPIPHGPGADRRMESAFGVFAVVKVGCRALKYFFIARQQPHAEGTGEDETYLALAGEGKEIRIAAAVLNKLYSR